MHFKYGKRKQKNKNPQQSNIYLSLLLEIETLTVDEKDNFRGTLLVTEEGL